jgi:hypothetical protein
MSVRPSTEAHSSAAAFRTSVEGFRAAEQSNTELTFDQLSETERNVASLGVSPDAFKPIGFMNAAHYLSLLKNNALSGELTQKIESYKHIAGQ